MPHSFIKPYDPHEVVHELDASAAAQIDVPEVSPGPASRDPQDDRPTEASDLESDAQRPHPRGRPGPGPSEEARSGGTATSAGSNYGDWSPSPRYKGQSDRTEADDIGPASGAPRQADRS